MKPNRTHYKYLCSACGTELQTVRGQLWCAFCRAFVAYAHAVKLGK